MDLPKLPEGYYYKFAGRSLYDEIRLMKRRRFWFDKKIAHEYGDLLRRYPLATTSFDEFLAVHEANAA